jgi:phosphate transport system ATP-binding protein
VNRSAVTQRRPQARLSQDDFTHPGEPILQARALSLWYGKQQALDSVTLDIAKNKITAIIGPSGCGKSTLIRCFNRMNDLVPGVRLSGEVLYHGKNIYDPDVDPVEVRRRIGMVFQKPNPFPKSIYENVAFGLRINGFRGNLDGHVEQALRAAALWDEVKDYLHTKSGYDLSGGQQQRLVHRAHAGDRARSDLDGRAVLGPRSHRYGEDRRFNARAQRALYGRDRDS